jgi:hypothetical protein
MHRPGYTASNQRVSGGRPGRESKNTAGQTPPDRYACRRGDLPGVLRPDDPAREQRLHSPGMPLKDSRQRRMLAGRAQAAKRAADGSGPTGVLRPGNAA